MIAGTACALMIIICWLLPQDSSVKTAERYIRKKKKEIVEMEAWVEPTRDQLTKLRYRKIWLKEAEEELQAKLRYKEEERRKKEAGTRP